jgi:hypothetical protein
VLLNGIALARPAWTSDGTGVVVVFHANRKIEATLFDAKNHQLKATVPLVGLALSQKQLLSPWLLPDVEKLVRKAITASGLPKIVDTSNAMEQQPSSATDVASKEQIDSAGPVPPAKGGIVAKKRSMTTGDEYLLGIKNGGRHAIPELSEKDVAGIDLAAIRAGTELFTSSKPEIQISDPITAYARVLDLGISLISEIVCRGTYTSSMKMAISCFTEYRMSRWTVTDSPIM